MGTKVSAVFVIVVACKNSRVRNINICDSDQQCITMPMLHLTQTRTSGKVNKETAHLTVGLSPLSVILDVTNFGYKTNHIYSS